MWAPVSNRKPPPDSSGCWRQVPSVSVAQSCQTTALMLRIGPSSPARAPGRCLADLRRAAALERDDEQPPGGAAGSRASIATKRHRAVAAACDSWAGGGSQTGDDVGHTAVEDLLDVLAGHHAGADEPDARACRSHP